MLQGQGGKKYVYNEIFKSLINGRPFQALYLNL